MSTWRSGRAQILRTWGLRVGDWVTQPHGKHASPHPPIFLSLLIHPFLSPPSPYQDQGSSLMIRGMNPPFTLNTRIQKTRHTHTEQAWCYLLISCLHLGRKMHSCHGAPDEITIFQKKKPYLTQGLLYSWTSFEHIKYKPQNLYIHHNLKEDILTLFLLNPSKKLQVTNV